MNLDNDEFKILKNMNEISAKKNMIFTLTSRIEELTKKKEKYKNFRKKYIPYNVYYAIANSIVLPPLIISYFTKSNPFLVTSTFYQYEINLVLTVTLFGMGLCLPVILPIELKSYEYHKKKQKEIKNSNYQLVFSFFLLIYSRVGALHRQRFYYFTKCLGTVCNSTHFLLKCLIVFLF